MLRHIVTKTLCNGLIVPFRLAISLGVEYCRFNMNFTSREHNALKNLVKNSGPFLVIKTEGITYVITQLSVKILTICVDVVNVV